MLAGILFHHLKPEGLQKELKEEIQVRVTFLRWLMLKWLNQQASHHKEKMDFVSIAVEEIERLSTFIMRLTPILKDQTASATPACKVDVDPESDTSFYELARVVVKTILRKQWNKVPLLLINSICSNLKEKLIAKMAKHYITLPTN